jgi:predicted nucleotidyltransferase
MHPAIAQHRSGIAAICQRYHINRLEVFGSAARADDFNPASSDADFLVEFGPDAPPSLEAFFGAKADLEQLLGRGVDLVEPGAVRNPYVLASINRNREAVYAAGSALQVALGDGGCDAISGRYYYNSYMRLLHGV